MRFLSLILLFSAPLCATTHYVVPNGYESEALSSKKDCESVRLFVQEKIQKLAPFSEEGATSKCIPMEPRVEPTSRIVPHAIVIETESDEKPTVHTFVLKVANILEKRPRAITKDVVVFKVVEGVLTKKMATEAVEADYRVSIPYSFDSTEECQKSLEQQYSYIKNFRLTTYKNNTMTANGKYLLDGKCIVSSEEPLQHKFFFLIVPQEL